MSGKKTIELKFGEGESPVVTKTDVTTSPKETVTKHNFNGFIIEVTRTKNKKPVSAEIKFSDENMTPNIIGCDQKKTTPSIPHKPPHVRSNPVGPKTEALVIQPDSTPIVVNDLEGAAGLWAENDSRAACFQSPEEEVIASPPTITEADYEEFKPEELEEACYGKLLLLGEQKLNKNTEDFVCSICIEYVVKHQGVVLKNCLHTFCSPCLVKHIKNNHDDFGQVLCPFSLNPCESSLDYAEISELLGEDFAAFEFTIVQLMDENIREKERLEKAGANELLLPFLIESDEQHYIENFEAFECQVCFGDTAVGGGIILKKCLHKFCKECLISTVQHSEDFEVKCPNNDPIDGNCKEFLTEREIKNMVPDDIFEKHLEKSLKLYEGTYAQAITHCKTPDCRGFVEPDENLRGFTCPVCSIVNCIGCKAIHVGKNCQQYQDEINPEGARRREEAESENTIQNMVTNNEAMYCPRCGIPVVKVEGCDYIVCTACKLGICWRTRKPRQPITLVNGAFVDGCHCKDNGIKCHPQCGNCH